MRWLHFTLSWGLSGHPSYDGRDGGSGGGDGGSGGSDGGSDGGAVDNCIYTANSRTLTLTPETNLSILKGHRTGTPIKQNTNGVSKSKQH